MSSRFVKRHSLVSTWFHQPSNEIFSFLANECGEIERWEYEGPNRTQIIQLSQVQHRRLNDILIFFDVVIVLCNAKFAHPRNYEILRIVFGVLNHFIRKVSNQQLIKNNAQRVYVHTIVEIVVTRPPREEMFRAHVNWTAADDFPLFVSNGHTEICQLDLVLMQHKVRRFDIAVNRFGRMDEIERVDGTSKVGGHCLFIKASVRRFLGHGKQILPITQLQYHAQIRCNVFLNLAGRRRFLVAVEITIHIDDRVMTERFVYVHLVIKVAVTTSVGVLDLEGNGMSRGVLASGIDGGTGTRTQLVQDSEIGEGPFGNAKIGERAVRVVSNAVFTELVECSPLI
mmetsp:Transcript_2307/g.6725  ORF Transcript_2307/g.6725 Transcript_2307/m.6725 type:complete len:341 (+) Transcript_2307:252-1274(+)